MFVLKVKDFVQGCFVAEIRAGTYFRDVNGASYAEQNPWLQDVLEVPI